MMIMFDDCPLTDGCIILSLSVMFVQYLHNFRYCCHLNSFSTVNDLCMDGILNVGLE